MERWEYRTLKLHLESWKQGREQHEDYVVTYTDGTRLMGLEMIMSRYLDDGGWELVSMVPTCFEQRFGEGLVAVILTAIFRRRVI